MLARLSIREASLASRRGHRVVGAFHRDRDLGLGNLFRAVTYFLSLSLSVFLSVLICGVLVGLTANPILGSALCMSVPISLFAAFFHWLLAMPRLDLYTSTRRSSWRCASVGHLLRSSWNARQASLEFVSGSVYVTPSIWISWRIVSMGLRPYWFLPTSSERSTRSLFSSMARSTCALASGSFSTTFSFCAFLTLASRDSRSFSARICCCRFSSKAR